MAQPNKNRIYGEKANIDENSAKEFWNNRANKYDEANPYVSVKFGDKQPERARKWDEYEKKNILPLLNISPEDNVLDVGCGVGRLAEAIIPNCKYYLGVDYAEKLIDIAKERVVFPGKDYAFIPMPMQDIFESNPELPLPDGKFSVIIIAGALPFLNDDTALSSINNILSVMAYSCRLYIADVVGCEQRLTLNRFNSDELEAEYSIIYRTMGEYEKLYTPLLENGFSISAKGDIPVDSAKPGETQRIYHILTR